MFLGLIGHQHPRCLHLHRQRQPAAAFTQCSLNDASYGEYEESEQLQACLELIVSQHHPRGLHLHLKDNPSQDAS
jgi:hypothetical protein